MLFPGHPGPGWNVLVNAEYLEFYHSNTNKQSPTFWPLVTDLPNAEPDQGQGP